MAGHPTKGGDDYLELYRITVGSVNTFVVALSAFLIVLLLSIIFPIEESLNELKTLKQTDGNQMQTLVVGKVERRLKAEGQLTDSGDLITINKMNIFLHANEREARAWQAAREQLAKEGERERRLTSITNFNILGFSIPVPNSFSCVAWFVTLIVMLLFIQHKRVIAFSLLARAFHAWQRERPNETQPQDFAGRVPFWLAPVRWTPNWASHVENFDEDCLLASLGWNRAAEFLAWLLALVFCGFWLVLSGYVTLVGVDLMSDHDRTVRLLELTQWKLDVFQFGFVFALLICIALMVAWLIPYKGSTRAPNQIRRGLIGSVPTAFLGAYFGAPMLERWINGQHYIEASPKQTDDPNISLADGKFFRYVGRRGPQIIYLPKTVRIDGYPDSQIRLTADRLSEVTISDLDLGQIRSDDFTLVVEIAVLERIGEDRDVAIALLKAAVLHMLSHESQLPVSYRLIDLLDRLYRTAKDEKGIEGLRATITASLDPGGRFADKSSQRNALSHRDLSARGDSMGRPSAAVKQQWSFFRPVYVNGNNQLTVLTVKLAESTNSAGGD